MGVVLTAFLFLFKQESHLEHLARAKIEFAPGSSILRTLCIEFDSFHTPKM